MDSEGRAQREQTFHSIRNIKDLGSMLQGLTKTAVTKTERLMYPFLVGHHKEKKVTTNASQEDQLPPAQRKPSDSDWDNTH